MLKFNDFLKAELYFVLNGLGAHVCIVGHPIPKNLHIAKYFLFSFFLLCTSLLEVLIHLNVGMGHDFIQFLRLLN